jgi:CheY-like chemotaxis protein
MTSKSEDQWKREGLYDAKILIADDDPLLRKLVAGVLRGQNFTNLEFAEGGVSALEKVNSFRPDLLLLDMQMLILRTCRSWCRPRRWTGRRWASCFRAARRIFCRSRSIRPS